MKNPYCDKLGIDVPRLEDVKDHREANTYALLLVALLERGEPMTLQEVAGRFAAAGIAPVDRALLSLRRCRPGRPPVYRDGDRYALDPHDDELDLWAFRLGLRPPKVPRLRIVRDPSPLPGCDVPLSVAELDETWREAFIGNWSAQRITLAVLDAHRRAMSLEEVKRFLDARVRFHQLTHNSPRYWRRGAPIRVREDGLLEIDPHHDALPKARKAVREQIEAARRQAALRPDPVVLEANTRAWEQRRAAHGAELAALRRVIVRAFPSRDPAMVVLVDVAEHRIETFAGQALDDARARIASYDVVAAVGVRSVLAGLGIDAQGLRLHEIGAAQKTKTLNRSGRILRITTAMLIQHSCGIARPLGEESRLRRYLREGQTTRLRRRLEADARSLYAMYQYGRLHGGLRLRWGFLDEWIQAPWVHLDEPRLHELMEEAHDRGVDLEVVTGTAPGWEQPWARARRCVVEGGNEGDRHFLVDEDGYVLDEREVQQARLVASKGAGGTP